MPAMIDRRDCVPIPGPRGYPLIGSIWELDRTAPINSFMRWARQFGEIYSLNLAGSHRVFINTAELLEEACNEKRFSKTLSPALIDLRNGVHDALFTSWTDEANWGLAHRILVPAFSPLNLQNMFPQMKDIITQCVLKWARHGHDHTIEVAEDWTRLTLDTLALTAMGYRFNSFYSNEMHPFVTAFMGILAGAASRATRPKIASRLYKAEDKKFFENIEYCRQLCAELLLERRTHPTEDKDLLTAMIEGKDPKTGQSLSEQSVIDNMITFLVAGHETTSGLLSFATYYLLRNPEAYRRAQDEIDQVVGKDSLRPDHLSKLTYLNAVLRETLRLSPTAPIWSVQPNDTTGEVLANKYFLAPKEVVTVNLCSIHRDPTVYGEDAEEFKPERMLDENMSQRSSYAWKPFGNGQRACIGRHFAWQEAVMALAITLQNFDLEMKDPQYALTVKQTLTMKPINFEMRAKLREGISATSLEQSIAGSTRPAKPIDLHKSAPPSKPTALKPITILYGSNCGTCEAFARTAANDAVAHGFEVSKFAALDSAKAALPTDQPTLIVTASYEGMPCDNARHFVEWLEKLPEAQSLNASYAVFGAGHSDWKSTFHKVPTAIDNMLAAHGCKRLCAMGKANAARGDMMSEFQMWEDEVFWPALASKSGQVETPMAAADNISIVVSTRRASGLQTGVLEAQVVEAKTLTAPGVPEKRHIEIKLPSEMSYRAGDYLALLPLNPEELVQRAMKRFGLSWDAMLTINVRGSTMLPTGQPISAHDLLSAYVELSQPATRRDLSTLLEATNDDGTKVTLQKLVDAFDVEITKKRVSLLDLLDRFCTIDFPLNAFVAALVPMRVRQYSISSSPLVNASHVTLTYAVLDQVAFSGQGRYQGVASTFLSKLRPGDSVQVAVKPSNQAFHLPTDAESTPVIMVCAGTGFAPFRGFVEERAAQITAGRKLPPAHLFIGCRHPDQDELYPDEMKAWESAGAVTVHRAYSRAPERSHGHKHVQEVLWSEKTLLQDLWDENAKVYVCGSQQLGESVHAVSLDIFRDGCKRKGEEADLQRAEAWFSKIRNERYSTDVFA